jgi:hypothetical protein
MVEVGVAVAAVAAFAAGGLDQTAPFVEAEGLGVQAGEVGGDRHHIDGGVSVRSHSTSR